MMSIRFPSRALACLTPAAVAVAAALSSWGAHAAGQAPLLNDSVYRAEVNTDWKSLPHGSMLTFHEVYDESKVDEAANPVLKDLLAKGNYSQRLRAWRVSYVTTGADADLVATRPGQPYVATGILLVPISTPWPTADRALNASHPYNSNRPIVVFAPKTQGIGSDCAPSKALELGTEELSEVKRMVVALNKGYAVAVTDYEGYTDNGPAHQYLVGQTGGHAVLDMALAVKQILPGINAFDYPGMPTKLTASSPMAIWGYSEGGLAASWAGQLLPTYAPLLVGAIKSVATGGTVADLRRAAVTLDFTPGSGMELSGVWGFHVAYPKPYLSGGPYFEVNDTFKRDLLGNEVAQWGTAAPKSSTPGALLHPSTCVDQLGASQGLKSMLYRNNGLRGTYRGKTFNTSAFTITQLTDTPELGWAAMLKANNPGSIKINLPTYFYHGSTAVTLSSTAGSYGDAKEGDVLLNAESFNKYFADMCANRTPVWRQVVPSTYLSLTTHENASDKAFEQVIAWTTSHLKGEAPAYDPKPLLGVPTVMRCSDRR
jgi:Secretory lipase